MSSEMRDEIACEIVRNVCESDPADPDAPTTVCIDVTRLCEIVDNALLARTEAGPSLLCQSDACAHKGTVHNLCTPRTEAGAVCDHAWQPDSDVMNARYCPKCDVTQTIPKKTTHPQDASGDAAMREALENSNSLLVALLIEPRDRTEIEQQIADNRAAMQAKEAK